MTTNPHPDQDAPLWRRLLRCPTPTRKAPPMITDPDTTATTPADRIHALRDELDQIDAHEAADPLDTAENLDLWHQRNSKRSRRRAEIARQVRDLEAFGELVDTHLRPIRDYLAQTAEVRRRLGQVAEHRHQAPNHGQVEEAAMRHTVTTWYGQLVTLARALPLDHPDAQRVLDREYQVWITARNGYALSRIVALEGGAHDFWLPSPECGIDGGLPPGMRYGVYRIADDGTVTLPSPTGTP